MFTHIYKIEWYSNIENKYAFQHKVGINIRPILVTFFACKHNGYIYLAFFERDQVRKIDEMMPQIRNPD